MHVQRLWPVERACLVVLRLGPSGVHGYAVNGWYLKSRSEVSSVCLSGLSLIPRNRKLGRYVHLVLEVRSQLSGKKWSGPNRTLWCVCSCR